MCGGAYVCVGTLLRTLYIFSGGNKIFFQRGNLSNEIRVRIHSPSEPRVSVYFFRSALASFTSWKAAGALLPTHISRKKSFFCVHSTQNLYPFQILLLKGYHKRRKRWDKKISYADNYLDSFPELFCRSLSLPFFLAVIFFFSPSSRNVCGDVIIPFFLENAFQRKDENATPPTNFFPPEACFTIFVSFFFLSYIIRVTFEKVECIYLLIIIVIMERLTEHSKGNECRIS